MTRKKIYLISGAVAFLIFFVIPELRAFAQSASCSGSSPISCVLQDAFDLTDSASVNLGKIVSFTDSFNLSDSLQQILLGLPNIPLTDSFHLAGSTPQVIVSNPICNNPFVTSTICNPTSGPFPSFFDTNSTLGKVVTEIGVPSALLMGVIFVPAKWGVKSFYIIFPVVNFVLLGLTWIGILPSWFVIADIIIISAGVAFIIIQLFTGQSATSAPNG